MKYFKKELWLGLQNNDTFDNHLQHNILFCSGAEINIECNGIEIVMEH